MLLDARLKAFVVSSQIAGTEVVARFVSNLPAIERACRRDGPSSTAYTRTESNAGLCVRASSGQPGVRAGDSHA
ncbi:hypothetical protein SAMN05216377_105294 [Pseudonocardia oroxyli]|uniref:Uncharacterized protein n=1 Tax=Pseudonocardia oroxyli TaxID=366584 RepID=A0A1G7MAE9_PSEOR|nr:hypothetical protein SAMN05216377_105294 [Pseudonocardia oroxyli]